MITISTVKKLFRSLCNRLKANMKSSRVLQRKTRLSIIVIVSILTSKPSRDSEMVDLMLMECVTEVSS